MKGRISDVASRLVLAVSLVLLSAVGVPDPSTTATPVVDAATGSLLKTLNIPAAAHQCGAGGVETSVAVVQGSKVGFPAKPILLVVSCLAGPPDGSNLYFLDPGTGSSAAPVGATLVTTLTTKLNGQTFAPPSGWAALATRTDKGDLLGCGSSSDSTKHTIYKISLADGAVTALFTTPNVVTTICDGLAWDTLDDTIWHSPENSLTISHYSETGAVLGTLTSPFPLDSGGTAACAVSGLEVAGSSLYVACGATTNVLQVSKSGSNPGTVFTAGTIASGHQLQDLACDPGTFAAEAKNAIWSKDKVNNQLFAFEIPVNTCGAAEGGSVIPARCTPPYALDDQTDGDADGLLDCWEDLGIDFNGDGTVDFNLPALGASKTHKDIYLEIDYMSTRLPDPLAISASPTSDVVLAFKNAPVTNPDGTTGITLHVLVDDAFPDNANLALEPCTAAASTGPAGTPDFDTIKKNYFGTAAERNNADGNAVQRLNAKRFVYHYGLNVNNLLGKGTTSGCAEVFGNDLVVSLGGWSTPGGTRDQQAATWLHELGHNLDERHGGGDNINCKPNYLSVMNYSHQFKANPIANRPLDYSRGKLGTVNENSLSEVVSLGGPTGSKTAHGPVTAGTPNADGPINWDRDRRTGESGYAGNITNFGFGSGCEDSALSALEGHDDWAHAKLNFRASLEFADGAPRTTPSEAIGISEDQLIKLNANTDTIPPVTTASVPPPPVGSNDWYKSPPLITLEATDKTSGDPGTAGIASINYQWVPPDASGPSNESFDGWEEYKAPFTAQSDKDLYAFSVDKAGNKEKPVKLGPFKVDSTAPSLNPTVSPNPVLLNGSATATPNATDTGSGIASQSCDPIDPKVTSSVGAKTVTCIATDKAGNVATKTASYTVVYDFKGFFSPVENPDAINKARAGSDIPLKFSLGGNRGLNAVATASSRAIDCTSRTPLSNTNEQPIPPGGGNLDFNAGTNQYVYTLRSDPNWAGSCRRLTLNLNDATAHFAYFEFAK